VALAGLALASGLILPLWVVRLHAPQYPEGLGMRIGVHAVQGIKENDLQSINNLNHYIGMKRIDGDAIPELRFMPWILGALSVGALAVAAIGRRAVLVSWASALAVVLGAGLYDMWRWEYDYGHDLDMENAIIKIPGMSYQPPLVGTKHLLNFTATSWPGAGGWMILAATLLVAAAIFLAYRKRSVGGVAIALTVAACGRGPVPVRVGQDACEYCRMTVSDARFAGEVVNEHGRASTFDSIECLASYTKGSRIPAAHLWVANFADPTAWIPAHDAAYLKSDRLPSPMGRHLAAFVSTEAAVAAQREMGGTVLSWNEVLAATGEAVAGAR
jgi:copper chaperone NosL